jgi:ABC-type methionine transport system permease subunit
MQLALTLPMLTIILVVALLLALGGGGWGHSRYGYASWSPAGIILVVLLVMLFTGAPRW